MKCGDVCGKGISRQNTSIQKSIEQLIVFGCCDGLLFVLFRRIFGRLLGLIILRRGFFLGGRADGQVAAILPTREAASTHRSVKELGRRRFRLLAIASFIIQCSNPRNRSAADYCRQSRRNTSQMLGLGESSRVHQNTCRCSQVVSKLPPIDWPLQIAKDSRSRQRRRNERES